MNSHPSSQDINFTLLIFAYNEINNLEKLIPLIYSTLNHYSFSIVVINDGSTDETLLLLQKFESTLSNFAYISYPQNMGKSFTFMKSLITIDTPYIITIDADLSDNIAEIPTLLPYLQQYDYIATWRYDRQDSLLLKLIPTFSANKFMNIIYKLPLHDFNCSLKLFKNKKELKTFFFDTGSHRFLSYILIKLLNYSFLEIKTSHLKRSSGKSKYNSIHKRLISFLYLNYLVIFKKYDFKKPYSKTFLSSHIN